MSGIPLAEGFAFDLITAFGLLEFVSPPLIILKKIKSLLVPGGEAWITFEATRQDQNPSIDTKPPPGVVRYHYSEKEIRTLLDQTGLKILSLERGFGYLSPSTQEEVSYFFVQAQRSKL